jgi:uncharacterized small protein (DUF1192 family)
MTLFEAEPAPRSSRHEIGQDLSPLSRDELLARIAILQGEIKRLEEEIQSKGAVKSAAEALFRRD